MSDIDVKVVKVSSIEPHNNAERLEFVKLGDMDFRCVVGKGQFQVGDLCIYIMPDCVLPQEMITKLQNNSKIKVDARIRPIKIRGEYSEGLCLVPSEWLSPDQIVEGNDVKELLQITKYEPQPEKQGNGTSKNINPFYQNSNFIEYRCVEKYKKMPKVMDELECDVSVSVKIHGSSGRWGYVKKPQVKRNWLEKTWHYFFGDKSNTEFLVGSHGSIRKPSKNSIGSEYTKEDNWWKIAKKYDLEKVCSSIRQELFTPDTEVVIYGEIYGDGIQKFYNYGLKNEIDLKVFDIMVNKKFKDWDFVVEQCKKYNLPIVEEIYRGPWKKELVELAHTVDIYNGSRYVREGVVIKPVKETWNSKCGRVIMKYLNPAYEADKKNSEFH